MVCHCSSGVGYYSPLSQVSYYSAIADRHRGERIARLKMLTRDRLTRLCAARNQLRAVGLAELSIDEIAKASAISRFHFVRQFKAVFGETPIQFRTRSRLEKARQLLVDTDDSVTDVCLAVGFSSLGSFSALFARRFGRSPSAFRDELRESAEKLTPTCMSILREAWTRKSQISRSQQVSDQVIY